jgi:hypothetical protein
MKGRTENVLNFKKRSRVVILATVALAVGLVVGWAASLAAREPLIEMEVTHKDNPAYWFKTMQLKWDKTIYYDITASWANPLNRGNEIGYAQDENSTNWRIFELHGYSRDYLLAYERDNMNVFRLMYAQPPEIFATYILENATEKQGFERLLSVTLYNDGTAILATPPISSYALISPYYYSFADSELLSHYESDNVIARFAVIDDNTLVFKESNVPLFADMGARYVSA